jgi:hypothetical protein
MFWAIAKYQLNTQSMFNKPELFVVKDGSGTVDAEYTLSGPLHVRFRYERVGDWVAVYAVRGGPARKAELERLGLKVVK